MDELIKRKVVELFTEVYGVNLQEDVDGDTILLDRILLISWTQWTCFESSPF